MNIHSYTNELVTAREKLTQADSLMQRICNEYYLFIVKSDSVTIDGKSKKWQYVFANMDSTYWISVDNKNVYLDSSKKDMICCVATIPEDWIDSDYALYFAEHFGGKRFREIYPNYQIEAYLSRYLTPELPFYWHIKYKSKSNPDIYEEYQIKAQGDPNDYFPLELGNRWIYTSTTDHEIVEIVIDTVTINNKKYYKIDIDPSPWDLYCRKESLKVYVLDTLNYQDILIYDFSLDEGDTIFIKTRNDNILLLYGSYLVVESYDTTIITDNTTYDNCFAFSHQPAFVDAGTVNSFFCRGIGKVKFINESYAGEIEYYLTDYILKIENANSKNLPTKLHLYQNYPNPFNSSTQIKFYLPYDSYVRLEIYNINGQLVDVLLNSKLTKGYHNIKWDAKNLPTGIYFYKLTAGNYHRINKCLLVK